MTKKKEPPVEKVKIDTSSVAKRDTLKVKQMRNLKELEELKEEAEKKEKK